MLTLKRSSRQKGTTEPFHSSNKTTATKSSCRVDNVSHVETKPAVGQIRRTEKWPEKVGGEEEASRKHEVWWGNWRFAQRKHFKEFLRTVHLRNSEIFFPRILHSIISKENLWWHFTEPLGTAAPSDLWQWQGDNWRGTAGKTVSPDWMWPRNRALPWRPASQCLLFTGYELPHGSEEQGSLLVFTWTWAWDQCS